MWWSRHKTKEQFKKLGQSTSPVKRREGTAAKREVKKGCWTRKEKRSEKRRHVMAQAVRGTALKSEYQGKMTQE